MLVEIELFPQGWPNGIPSIPKNLKNTNLVITLPEVNSLTLHNLQVLFVSNLFEYWKVFNLAWKMNLSDWWVFLHPLLPKRPKEFQRAALYSENQIQGILALCEFHYCDFSKHSRNMWLMHFLAKIFHYWVFYYTAKYRKNCSNEIFWPKNALGKDTLYKREHEGKAVMKTALSYKIYCFCM